MIALDAAGFGVRRAALIEKLFAHSAGYGLFKTNKLNAFALCRPFGRGHVVGPVVAESDADAVAIVRPHVMDHPAAFCGSTLIWRAASSPPFCRTAECRFSIRC